MNHPSLAEAFIPESIFYSLDQLKSLDKAKIPAHVAFIPDGNRRWAKQQEQTTARGHRAGADMLMDIVQAAKELGVKVVTFYIFSTENWARNADEVQALLWLLESYLIEQRPSMVDKGIRLDTIGDLSRFPESIQDTIAATKEFTKDCSSIDMVFALNYGGRDEICRAVQKLLDDKDRKGPVTEASIKSYLDTAQWPDPDLLIRTSGEMRISNFLIWQTSYTEVYIADVLWPDFTPDHLLEALLNFQKRTRRWGGA